MIRSVEISVGCEGVPSANLCGEWTDDELLGFALGLAGTKPVVPTVSHLLAEFGDVEIILASAPEDLCARGGLTNRAIAVLKLLQAFRTDNRRGLLLN